MVDHTHYYLHLFDAHGRGRTNGGPLTIDPVAGQVLEFYAAPTPPLEINAVLSGATSGACARVTKVLAANKCVVESIPRVGPGLAFAQNSQSPGFGETIDLDNCQGTGSGYLVNNVAGYAIGATSIAVDTGVGTMLVGDRLKFAGHATLYTVATALTAGTVVITPALTASVANNEAVTLRGGTVNLLPLGTSQLMPTGNQYLLQHNDSSLTAPIDRGLGEWSFWDRSAEICETIGLISATGSFLKGDEVVASTGGRATVQVVQVISGGIALALTRKRGTWTVGATVTNITRTGAALLIANDLFGPTPQGLFVRYSPMPNAGGSVLDDYYYERIPNGNGGPGLAGVGPDAKLLHLLDSYHQAADSVTDRSWRYVPFSSWDDEGPADGNLGGVTIQVVRCSGTFPASGTLVAGQTVTRGSWSGVVHGWSNTNKYLFVRSTNGQVLTAGTLTTSGGATVTGTGPALGWAKGSTHWNNMAAQWATATTAFGAVSGSAAIQCDGVIAQPWETELAMHATANGCPYPTTEQVQQAWLQWAQDLRTLVGNPDAAITTWEHRDESQAGVVDIVPGYSFAKYHNSNVETLPVVVPKLTVVRSAASGYQMASDAATTYLRTEDYLDLGEKFFRHLLFGQISVNPGDGLEEVAVGVHVGQSQMTGYIPASLMMSVDRDPDLWPSALFPGANTIDQNDLRWNPLTMAIEPCDIAVNGGNGSWGTAAGTLGPDHVVNKRMVRRFSSDPTQSTRFVSFKFTVPGSCLNSNVHDANGCWDPSLTTRPATTANCAVSVLTGPARGRFTATAGTFSGPQWIQNASVTITGSALGALGIGGNNTGQWTVQRVHTVATDGSWVEIQGAFVAEASRPFTITVGPPPIWPEFLRQWVAFQRDCQRLGIIPKVVFINFEQGESDLEYVTQYEAALRRVWTELVAKCAKRVKGSEPVAKCITLVHSQTPFSPFNNSAIATMRQIQTAMAVELGNCVTVDPSDLPLEINQYGSWPRTQRELNGVHHTAWAMIQKGFRVDKALATLGAAKGIPPHPRGEVAVDFGAVDGGTGTTGTGGGTDAAGTNSDQGTDAIDPAALVVEDGSGVAGAESFCSIDALDEYWAKNGSPVAVTGATDAAKAEALRRATREWVEGVCGGLWRGSIQHQHQRLSFPRIGCYDDEGRWLAMGTVPWQLVDATAIVAGDLLAGGTILANGLDRGAITSETKKGVGFEKTVTYSDKRDVGSIRRLRAAEALVYPFIQSTTLGVSRS